MKIFNIIAAGVLMVMGSLSAQGQTTLPEPKKNDVSIGNVKLSRDDKDLVLDYEIRLGDNVLSCSVEVIMLVGGADGQKYPLTASELKGDFGKITQSGAKQIRYNVERSKERLAGRDIRFTLNVKGKNVLDNEILAMGSVAVMPQMSYGLMLGYVKKFGGYIKFRSDFNFAQASYQCNSTGEIDGGGYMWSSGARRHSRLQATGGVLFRAAKWLYPYAGVGYGARSVHWQDWEGNWAQVSDYSCVGVAAEAGLILKLGPVAVSAGVSNTAFKFTELEVGVGVMF